MNMLKKTGMSLLLLSVLLPVQQTKPIGGAAIAGIAIGTAVLGGLIGAGVSKRHQKDRSTKARKKRRQSGPVEELPMERQATSAPVEAA